MDDDLIGKPARFPGDNTARAFGGTARDHGIVSDAGKHIQPAVFVGIRMGDADGGVNAIAHPAKGAVADAHIINDAAKCRPQESIAVRVEPVGFGRKA